MGECQERRVHWSKPHHGPSSTLPTHVLLLLLLLLVVVVVIGGGGLAWAGQGKGVEIEARA
jgi:hypothetical protein